MCSGTHRKTQKFVAYSDKLWMSLIAAVITIERLLTDTSKIRTPITDTLFGTDKISIYFLLKYLL